jgi:hypothetical protein
MFNVFQRLFSVSLIYLEVGIPLTGLTVPPFCVCPKPGPGFPTSYVLDLIVLSEFS